MQLYLLIIKCLFLKIVVSRNVHEYMTEPELLRIFGTNDKGGVPDYEVVYLPIVRVAEGISENGEVVDIDYGFNAFGRSFNLMLKPNRNLVPDYSRTYIWKDEQYPDLIDNSYTNCHYLHKDDSITAAISICEPNATNGLLFLENSTLEIHPIPKHLHGTIKRSDINQSNENYPHIVRRATFETSLDPREQLLDILPQKYLPPSGTITYELEREAASHKPVGGLTVELALFFDEAGYKIFAPYLNYDDQKLRDMLLAYMNGVQALYHHPSLGTTLELVLVRLDIMKRQPNDMPHYDGERSKLLDSFCDYQKELNPKGDANPEHWDMALYVSGLDFFAYENGRKSGVTMGLATVGGVCLEQYNCVIAELGTTNVYGKPYPSAGFTSVYILAHEMGHNLGMHHDSSGNTCPKEGYIMSPSRGTNGETQWSSCSAKVMTKLSWAKCLNDSPGLSDPSLDHSRFLDSPGQSYTAKKQCEVLLTDRDAIVLPSQKLETICHNLNCKTPHRSGYYFAGPALEGTECGKGKYCFGGECVSKTLQAPMKIKPGGWGPWQPGTCISGCIKRSVGYQGRQRFCNNPPPVNTDQGCEGSSYTIALCPDDKLCSLEGRISADVFASEKCKNFAKLLPELDPKGVGLQAPHEEERLWMGCTIFCKKSDSKMFFTPRMELNDLGVSPYFPDGTLCHSSNGVNFYCLQHHCLPEHFQFTKGTNLLYDLGGDVPLSQNAYPMVTLPPEIKNYLSIGANGKPLKNKIKPGEFLEPKEEEWETKDYIELPNMY